MTARQATPFDFETRTTRLSPRTTLIVAASIGLHAAIAAYLKAVPPVESPAPEPGSGDSTAEE